ncbi:hypothetical protein C0J52_14831 [Blattella germanica]|nr:hypothetical protein C0J52_14831 [Blattella germanica]
METNTIKEATTRPENHCRIRERKRKPTSSRKKCLALHWEIEKEHHIGHSHNDTLKETESRGKQHVKNCTHWGDKKAFKVGFPFHHLKETELPEFYPQGIIVRKFRFQKSHRDEGVDLE